MKYETSQEGRSERNERFFVGGFDLWHKRAVLGRNDIMDDIRKLSDTSDLKWLQSGVNNIITLSIFHLIFCQLNH